MFALTVYAAEAAQDAPPQPDPGAMFWQTILMFGMIFAVFYFLLIRPQQKQRQKHEERVNQLKKGDKVITAGGIHGSIIGLKDDIAVVKIAENVKIEIQKSSISTILSEEQK